MEEKHSYQNMVKLKVDEKALSPSRRRSVFLGTFLALLVLLMAVLLVAVAVLYFQKDRKLQELEGVIEKIRSTLKLSDVPFSPGNRSQSFRLSDTHLLENIHQTFAEIQTHLEDIRASRDAAEERCQANPWQAAEASCQSHGAHLTSVTSREEEEYLIRETRGKEVWIGLADRQEEGKWTWADGNKYSQDAGFWLSGQPDNWHGAPGHREDCVLLTTGWNDISCTYNYKWICKKQFRVE